MSNPNQTPAPRGGGLSLYANLLDPESSTPGTISKGPVVFKPADAADDGSAKKPQIDSGKHHCPALLYLKKLTLKFSCSAIPADEKTTAVAKAQTKIRISQI